MGQLDCTSITPMTQDEKLFFKQLGARIAQLRKERGLTQVQLAQLLDLTQQMVASYEVGRRRVPVSLLPAIADALTISIEELIGRPPARALWLRREWAREVRRSRCGGRGAGHRAAAQGMGSIGGTDRGPVGETPVCGSGTV